MKKIIIIPARMQSVRFPGKVIYPIHGIPMVVRTAKCAQEVLGCDQVVVATEDPQVVSVCADWAISTIVTGAHHHNGTERCAEAARILGLESTDQVINLQADLPHIQPDLLAEMFKFIPYYIMTAAVAVEGSPSTDANIVKVAMAWDQKALWFSRKPIRSSARVWYNHIGVYGFENKDLQQYARLLVCDMELQESLEQMRILYSMKRQIKVLITKEDCISVNVLSDLDKLNIYWPVGQVTGHVV